MIVEVQRALLDFGAAREWAGRPAVAMNERLTAAGTWERTWELYWHHNAAATLGAGPTFGAALADLSRKMAATASAGSFPTLKEDEESGYSTRPDGTRYTD